ncbi:MAG: hypothetical protein AB7S81_08505 [Bdellovibrionales bacterium]
MRSFICFRFSWLFLLLLLALPLEVVAGGVCLLDGRSPDSNNPMDPCPTTGDITCGDSTAVTSTYWGARVNPGIALTPIDVHTQCRYVDNNSADGYFVPFKISEEWKAFRSYPPTGVSLVTCARPFSGQNSSSGLLFGPTSAIPAMGDTGATTADVSLPYARTGTAWPPSETCANATHTFGHSCYEEESVANCWKWVPKTCEREVCSGEGDEQTCVSESYDCTYCDDWGSICKKNWTSWTETFSFTATAGNPGWSGQSVRTSSATRPDSQCTQRCTFDGHDCTDCNCAPTGETTCTEGTLYDSCGNNVGTCEEEECCCQYWGY